MQVRLSTRQSRFRRPRRSRGRHDAAGATERDPEPNGQQIDPHRRFAEPHNEITRAREAGPPQDEALYTCQCGVIFQAPVSTSVGCPGCGDSQAW